MSIKSPPLTYTISPHLTRACIISATRLSTQYCVQARLGKLATGARAGKSEYIARDERKKVRFQKGTRRSALCALHFSKFSDPEPNEFLDTYIYTGGDATLLFSYIAPSVHIGRCDDDCRWIDYSARRLLAFFFRHPFVLFFFYIGEKSDVVSRRRDVYFRTRGAIVWGKKQRTIGERVEFQRLR